MSAQMLAPRCCVTRLSEVYSVSVPTSFLHLQIQLLPVLLLPLQCPHAHCWSLHRAMTNAVKVSADAGVQVCFLQMRFLPMSTMSMLPTPEAYTLSILAVRCTQSSQ